MIEEFEGVIVEGDQLASGQVKDHPNFSGIGTLQLQMPYFVDMGIEDIENMYSGTINIKIDKSIEIRKPKYIVENVNWHEDIFESFAFLNCTLIHNRKEYKSYIYQPSRGIHSDPKENLIEIITFKVDDLKYGDKVSVIVASKYLKKY